MTRATLLALIAVALAGCGGVESSGVRAGGDAAVSPLLSGGPEAFRARLASLRGHPVVVNQWASWCGPCQYEFPFFAALAKRYNGRITFLGVNTKDSASGARRFLARHPVPFPHFADPDGSIARVFRGGRAFPTTAFYNRAGRLTMTHSGSYASQGKLDADIRRYALNG